MAEARPIDPADLIVLTVSIIITILAVADLVSRQQQRHAVSEKERRQQIAARALPKLTDRRIVGWALGAPVGAFVVVGPITIVFAVRFVVLLRKHGEISQREAVVDRDMIDAGARRTAQMTKQIGRAC